MDIIKKISKNKNQRNIILFDTIHNNNNYISLKKTYKLDEWLESSMLIYKIYNGDI